VRDARGNRFVNVSSGSARGSGVGGRRKLERMVDSDGSGGIVLK
jgi:hypothetical protein